MQILKVIARLLDYPREEVRLHRADLAMAIGSATEISPDMRSRLLDLLGEVYQQDLLDAEESYSALFDHGVCVVPSLGSSAGAQHRRDT